MFFQIQQFVCYLINIMAIITTYPGQSFLRALLRFELAHIQILGTTAFLLGARLNSSHGASALGSNCVLLHLQLLNIDQEGGYGCG